MKNLLTLAILLMSSWAHAFDVSGSGQPSTLGPTAACSVSDWNLDNGTLYVSCANNRVGVLNTSPLFDLDVTGDQRISSNLLVVDTATVQGNAFSVGTSTLVVTGGNVGIGTTSPAGKLGINTSANGLVIDHTGAGTGFQYDYWTNTGNQTTFGIEGASAGNLFAEDLAYQSVWGSSLSNPVGIGTNGTIRMTIDTSGNVGIGTVVPATKLHLSSGTIRMVGTSAPTTGGALCLNAAGSMEKCTSAVDASGNCTCP